MVWWVIIFWLLLIETKERNEKMSFDGLKTETILEIINNCDIKSKSSIDISWKSHPMIKLNQIKPQKPQFSHALSFVRAILTIINFFPRQAFIASSCVVITSFTINNEKNKLKVPEMFFISYLASMASHKISLKCNLCWQLPCTSIECNERRMRRNDDYDIECRGVNCLRVKLTRSSKNLKVKIQWNFNLCWKSQNST